MNFSPRRFKRGTTSLERPGKVFLRYGKTTFGEWREEWVTKEKFDAVVKLWKQRRKIRDQTPEGRKIQATHRKKQVDSGYSKTYMKDYLPKWQARPMNKLSQNYRSRMRIALKHQGVKKNSKTEETLGCSFEFFRGYMEAQFKPGMTMENYGKVWVVDHIMPVSSFDLFDPRHLSACFHYTNCQPLFKAENHSKNDKIPGTDKNGRNVPKNVIQFQIAAA